MRQRLQRHLVLPTILALRGEAVPRYRNQFEQSQWKSRDFLVSMQLNLLKDQVKHALDHFPMYRKKFEESGHSFTKFLDLNDISKIPILEKEELTELRNQAATYVEGRHKTSLRMTAGSGGDPSIVVVDRDANAASLAARFRSQAWFGIRPEHFQLRFWGRPIAEGKWREGLKDFSLNRVRLNSLDVSNEGVNRIIRRLKPNKPAYIYGYSSLILKFCAVLEDSGIKAHRGKIKAAILTSETSSKAERDWAADVLQCPVVNEYGCSEVDIISFECPAGSHHVMAENVFVEQVEFKSEAGLVNELVVTDLRNKAMPMIRYRLGDIGELGDASCPCGRGLPLISRIEGRKQGQYIVTADGKAHHSQTICYVFESMVNKGIPIRKFRIIQEDVEKLSILVNLREDSSLIKESITRDLNIEVKKVLDAAIQLEVKFVSYESLIRNDQKFTQFESLIDKQ